MKNAGLSELEELTLLIVVTLGPDAYGVPIQAKLEKDARRPVALGAVYAALDRLERNGVVASSIGDPTPERGGRAKRYFRVTPRGVRAAQQTQQALVALWRGLPQMKETPA